MIQIAIVEDEEIYVKQLTIHKFTNSGVRTFSWTKLLFLNYVYIEMDSFHLTIF